MDWAEEDIAALLVRRSELLGTIAQHERGATAVDRRFGEQGEDPAEDLALLKRKLVEVEAHLREAGVSFDA
jgi:hypothetical protein